jgi:quinoprotein glucose dehydrogenase
VNTSTTLRCALVLALLVAVPGGSTLSGRQAPQASKQPTALPRSVQLTPADATRLAAEARKSVSVELGPGVELSLFAPDSLTTDPVSLEFDDAGTLFVTSTSRVNSPLDIRGHPTWVPTVHTLKTVADLRAFYARELAPERSAQNAGWLPDWNKDGSHDQRDLAELKDRVYRVQDTNGDGIADASRIIVEGFNADPTYDVVGGLLYDKGDLIFGMAPGVWRLKDDNGDGVVDRQIVISEGYSTHPAFGGHGVSGVTMGPDGRLYWEVGDIGLDVVDKSGKRWSYPNQGAIMRSEPDGSGFEVFAAGIRNLQEFSFDEYGNLISVDNDGDHQGETERVVYIPNGSDSGWRSNWQYGKYTDARNNRYNVWMEENMFKPRFPGQAAYIVPPVAAYHSGPSGMVYNPGTALSDEWKNTFFVTSFPGSASNARVYGFTLKPEGAGFSLGTDRVLVRGILTVGLKFGPDGALYLADWITGWDSKNRGRVWKVDAPSAASSPTRAEVRKLIAEKFDAKPVADVAALLRHADMRIRQKAQFELVRRGDPQPLTAAVKADHQLARVHAIWGIGQLARKDAKHAALLTPLVGDTDGEIRAQAAKMIGDVRYEPAAKALLPLLKDAAPRARFFAAEALGRIAFKPASAPIVEMLAANDDKDVLLRHAGALALSRIGDTNALAQLSTHQSKGVRIAAVVALRRLRHADAARFLADADQEVVLEAARAINDDGGIEAALPSLARLLEAKPTSSDAAKPTSSDAAKPTSSDAAKPTSSDALLRRAISANLRTGDGAAVTRLAAFAGDTSRPEPMRVEAIAAIGVFPSPSPMDRVDGYYIGQAKPRESAAAQAALVKLLDGTAQASVPLKVALAEAAGRLQAQGASATLMAQLRSDPSPQVRVASLQALQALKVPNMEEVMKLAVADESADVRRAALGILPALSISNAAKVDSLMSVIKTGSTADQQAGFEVLGTMKTSEAEKALAGYFEQLKAGTLAAPVQLDLVDAMQTSGAASLQSQLEAFQKSRGADSLAVAFKDAILAGGNPRRGRDVALEHPAAQCVRCHAVGNAGSDVGPSLMGVATRLSREQLLQSLLEPNAVVSPGFGTVSVTLRDGAKVEGTLRQETDTEVVLMAGTPPAERRIAKAEIGSRTNPVSSMPPMGALLKPREIRDLVAFLGMLK